MASKIKTCSVAWPSIKEETETAIHPEKSIRTQTFTPSQPPPAPLTIPLEQQPQHSPQRRRRRRRSNMVRPSASVRPLVFGRPFPASDVSQTAFRAVALRWERGRRVAPRRGGGGRGGGGGLGATTTATTRCLLLPSFLPSKGSARTTKWEGRKSRLPASLASHALTPWRRRPFCSAPQSVTKLQRIEEQQ